MRTKNRNSALTLDTLDNCERVYQNKCLGSTNTAFFPLVILVLVVLNNVLDTVCTCCGAMGDLMLVCVVSGPINREMRNLISSLKNHNEQLKGEVSRYRRKLRETQIEVNKVCIYSRPGWYCPCSVYICIDAIFVVST